MPFAQRAPTRRAVLAAFHAVGGERWTLIVEARELVNERQLDVQAASLIFLTGPLQDKTLYGPIQDRALVDRHWQAGVALLAAGATEAEAAADVGEVLLEPVLLLVEEAPIDRIFVVEECRGRVFPRNPFEVVTPVEIDE